jgi:ABC-type dipeptide/oligopeptide/nickel transport system ATPase subunit
MTVFSVAIHSIQHIKSFRVEIDLTSHRLLCFVGRNGVGKTTFMRALRNLSSADTFLKTANPQIFDSDSRIEYEVDGVSIVFSYDARIRSLNCKQSISKEVRDFVSAELPMPYGARFNYFRSASDADAEIRRALIIENCCRPDELVEFLASIYSTNKYEALVEVFVKGKSYYCIRLADDRYIREDYLSSGEYFLINLYRTIKSSARLIAVDEIDLSLDAAAQVKLASWLRAFCQKYECSLVFTTHSLVVMRTLGQEELAYIEAEEDRTVYYPASYSYVKARLFGFQGWDKYILTEDLVLKEFIEYIVQKHCSGLFFSYKVIHVGGASQVTDLLRRNESEEFLSSAENVIAILDGDQRQVAHAQHPSVFFVPVDSVEKAIYAHYAEQDFPFKLPQERVFTSEKDVFNSIRQQRIGTTMELHEYLCARYSSGIEEFARNLGRFLGAAEAA